MEMQGDLIDRFRPCGAQARVGDRPVSYTHLDVYKRQSNNRDLSQDFFDCSLHKKNGSKCKGHFIRVKVLEGRVLSHVQRVTDYILRHEDYFRKVMEEQLRVESTEKLTVLKKQLARNEKRIADLKRLFMKIYEDNASGKLSDERFDMMSQSYDAEQKHLEEEALSIQQEIEVQEQQIENIEKFVQKAHKYVHIEELTPYACLLYTSQL